MITEIILIIFAIIYYVFSTFFFAVYIADEKYSDPMAWGLAIVTMFIAPVIVPVILGAKLGELLNKHKNDYEIQS